MITTECERLRDLLRGLEKAKTNVVFKMPRCEYLVRSREYYKDRNEPLGSCINV